MHSFPDLDRSPKHYIYLSVDSTSYDVHVSSSPVGRTFLKSINLVEVFTNYVRACVSSDKADEGRITDYKGLDKEPQTVPKHAPIEKDCQGNSTDENIDQVEHSQCDSFLENLKSSNSSSSYVVVESLDEADRRSVDKPISEGSFLCNICGDESRNFSHMLLHGRDLPFDCLLCMERMTSVDVLEKHVIMHMVKQSRYLDRGEGKLVENKEVNVKIEFEDSNEGAKIEFEDSNEGAKIEFEDSNEGAKIEFEDSNGGDTNVACNKPMKRKWEQREKITKESESLCNICGYKFPINQIYQHISHHGAVNKCDVCSKVFRTNDKLERHKVTQHTETVFDCVICNKRLSSAYRLKLHESRHGEKCHPCPYCTKLFTCQLDVTTHMKCHTEKDRYKCKHCDKTFMKNAKLKRHMSVHTGEKPYECSQCDKSFTTNSYLICHYNFKHGLDGKRCVCDKCHKIFVSADLMSEHECTARKNKKKRELKCDECGAIFQYMWKLKAHLDVHNTNRTVFKCELCCRQFVKKLSLIRHIKNIHPDSIVA